MNIYKNQHWSYQPNSSNKLYMAMPPKTSDLFTIALLLILFSKSLASFHNHSVLDKETICKYTQHADFCKFILPSNKNSNVFDYGRILAHQSLLNAHSFLGSVKDFLRHPSISSLSTARGALQDCQFLAELNVDYLSYTLNKIKSNDKLDSFEADELHALYSAALTNVETCLEGLEATPSASSIKKSLLPSISNGTKFYGVSLAVFKRGWGHGITKSATGKDHIFSNLANGRNSLSFRMSSHDQAKYETASGRKIIIQTDPRKGVVITKVVVVNLDGSGDFTTINDAVAAAPDSIRETDRHQYFLIYVAPGVYEEYVSISKRKQNLMMIGAGINKTIITGNRSASDPGLTTFRSATFAVVGKGFAAVNITFRNTAGPLKHQAVALRSGADLSTFYSCSFEGYQDTLYTHSLRQFYRECDIYGTVDIIFGNAAVVLQNCNIYPKLPLPKQVNTVTAQGRTNPDQTTGISIHNCVFKAADDLASSNGTAKTFLGRPWRNYSRTVIMQSFMDGLIEPSGWSEWSGDFALDTLYYAEYENKGPGSSTSSRVTWPGYHRNINQSDAANFTVSNFIKGRRWLPAIGVPFYGDLFRINKRNQ